MRNEYSSKAYSGLVSQFNIDMKLTAEQSSAIDDGKSIILSEEQFGGIVDQLISKTNIDIFLKENSGALLPLSVSLFVINDKLWSMMQRKALEKNKMLAMSTIPLCTWDQKHETTSNPKGIKRWPIRPNEVDISFNEKPKMKIQGEGGDFSGFIEQSHLTMRKWGIPDTRKLLPNYVFESLRIEVALNRATIESHPAPRDELDYDFSDHARVFYEHGFLVHVPGEDVILQVGKRKSVKMAGDVFLLVGKRFSEEDTSNQELLVDIWLRLLEKRQSLVT
ncbi:MAG: hypothetical protein OEV85_14800 [Candidatus Thorarchaeota archaeon]|nr:hypothetical protein [Candidatus Thorarchaeota archaeon]